MRAMMTRSVPTMGRQRANCCIAGTQPSNDRSSCVSCADLPAAKTECVPCTGTQYSITGQCQDCAEPNVVSEDHRTCTACGPGKEPNADRTACVDCTGTTYSQFGVQCQQCDDVVGPNAASCFFAYRARRARLVPLKQTECALCPVGRFAGSGAPSCEPCQAPLVTNAEGDGATGCITCSSGKAPNEDMSGCVDCMHGHDVLAVWL